MSNVKRCYIFLILVALVTVLGACGNDVSNKPKPDPPRELIGPGVDLTEVPRGQVPDSPYWLGPPREGAYLYITKPIPGKGRLVYVQPSDAAMIDSGNYPSSPIELIVINVSLQDVKKNKEFYARSRSYGQFTRVTPLGLGYASSSGRVVQVPLKDGRQIIIIKAPDQILLNNALALLRET